MDFSKFILQVQINNAFLFHDNRFNSIPLKRKIKIGVSDLLSTTSPKQYLDHHHRYEDRGL
jgi:hypothetical protein